MTKLKQWFIEHHCFRVVSITFAIIVFGVAIASYILYNSEFKVEANIFLAFLDAIYSMFIIGFIYWHISDIISFIYQKKYNYKNKTDEEKMEKPKCLSFKWWTEHLCYKILILLFILVCLTISILGSLNIAGFLYLFAVMPLMLGILYIPIFIVILFVGVILSAICLTIKAKITKNKIEKGKILEETFEFESSSNIVRVLYPAISVAIIIVSDVVYFKTIEPIPVFLINTLSTLIAAIISLVCFTFKTYNDNKIE